MTAILVTLASLAGLAFALLASAWLCRRLFHEERPYDERHEARTEDGWRLALHRYRSDKSGLPPLLLCHGIAANARNLDLDEGHSLAAWLRQQGRDVWVVDLRGVGDSARGEAGRATGWSFDAHVTQDLPAILTTVAAETGARHCDWVGYSMGGLVAYAGFGAGASEGTHQLGLRRLVTIGSPVVRRPHSAGDHGLVGALARFVRGLPLIRQAWLSTAFAWLGPAANRWLGGQVGVPGSSAPRQVRRAMVDVVSNVSGGVVAQFRSWMDTGRFESRSGTVDYAAGMQTIRVPALVVGGLGDRIAPPAAVRRGYELLGSPDKHLRLVGREQGQARDYGHMDLAFGIDARDDVYGPVTEFLNLP